MRPFLLFNAVFSLFFVFYPIAGHSQNLDINRLSFDRANLTLDQTNGWSTSVKLVVSAPGPFPRITEMLIDIPASIAANQQPFGQDLILQIPQLDSNGRAEITLNLRGDRMFLGLTGPITASAPGFRTGVLVVSLKLERLQPSGALPPGPIPSGPSTLPQTVQTLSFQPNPTTLLFGSTQTITIERTQRLLTFDPVTLTSPQSLLLDGQTGTINANFSVGQTAIPFTLTPTATGRHQISGQSGGLTAAPLIVAVPPTSLQVTEQSNGVLSVEWGETAVFRFNLNAEGFAGTQVLQVAVNANAGSPLRSGTWLPAQPFEVTAANPITVEFQVSTTAFQTKPGRYTGEVVFTLPSGGQQRVPLELTIYRALGAFTSFGSPSQCPQYEVVETLGRVPEATVSVLEDGRSLISQNGYGPGFSRNCAVFGYNFVTNQFPGPANSYTANGYEVFSLTEMTIDRRVDVDTRIFTTPTGCISVRRVLISPDGSFLALEWEILEFDSPRGQCLQFAPDDRMYTVALWDLTRPNGRQLDLTTGQARLGSAENLDRNPTAPANARNQSIQVLSDTGSTLFQFDHW